MHSHQIILTDSEIRVIIKRIAYQIAENHLNDSAILMVGLNDRGYFLANEIQKELTQILTTLNIELMQLPVHEISHSNIPKKENIIIVDDVINSGKTAFQSAAACLHDDLKKLETVFLAVREYRQFPVFANYTGISLATTIKEHVFFDNQNPQSLSVYLQ